MIEKIDFKKIQSPIGSFVAVLLTAAALVPVIGGNMMHAEAVPALSARRHRRDMCLWDKHTLGGSYCPFG